MPFQRIVNFCIARVHDATDVEARIAGTTSGQFNKGRRTTAPLSEI